jgi:hypothetical protein
MARRWSDESLDFNLDELYDQHVETRAPISSSLLDRGSGPRVDPTDSDRMQGNPRKIGSRGVSVKTSVENVDVSEQTPVTPTARKRLVCNTLITAKNNYFDIK